MEVEHAKARGEWIDPARANIRFGDWAEQHDAIRARQRPTTEARRESFLSRHVLPRFAAVPLSRVDHLTIAEWVADLARPATDGGAGLAASSVQKAFQLLSSTLAGAADAGLLPRNPAERVALPTDARAEARFLTPNEALRLEEAMAPRYRAFVTLVAASGLRIGEIAGPRRDRVDLLRGRVRVVDVVTEPRGRVLIGPPKTRAGRRTVLLPRTVTDDVAEHLARYADPSADAFVFPGRDGGVLRPTLFRSRVWHPAVDRAGAGTAGPA